MNDHDALQRAVCVDPLDDTVRLAYADWCDENENGKSARGEFIRLQIELANLGYHDDGKTISVVTGDRDVDSREQWIRRQLRSLLGFGPGAAVVRPIESMPWYRWAGEAAQTLPRRDTVGYVSWMFRRGFVDRIECTMDEFMDRDCDHCNGLGTERYVDSAGDMDDRPCESCGGSWRIGDIRNGTGIVPGFASTLFSKHPITRILFANVEPEVFDDMLIWIDIPDELKLYLPGGPDVGYPYDGFSADTALSLAGVNFGRERAGLPLITVEQARGL